MEPYFQSLLAFSKTPLAKWLIALSGITFLAGILGIPLILLVLPKKFFLQQSKPLLFADAPRLRWLFLILKNLLGYGFILFGLILLVLPGQGLLTILIGISLANFPGKNNLQQRILGNEKIREGLNSFRRKFKRELFIFEEES